MTRLGRARAVARAILPRTVQRRLRPTSLPAPGHVDFGDFRRTQPISRHFGFERGQPIDRFYIERFMAANARDIRGHVLEIGDATLTRQFGGDRVTHIDVLHVVEGSPGATIIGDLTAADHIPSDAFDCIVLTQTLHLIYDVPAAIATIHRILAPGGVILATVPGISQIERGQWRDTWFWSFTVPAARRRFEERFAPTEVQVEANGNALAAVAFLEGLASHELRPDELLAYDEAYPVLVAVRAVKGDSR